MKANPLETIEELLHIAMQIGMDAIAERDRFKALNAEFVAALEKIIEMNVQYCIDRFGDASQAESMGCVITARTALSKQGATVTGIDSDGVERMENEAHGGISARDYFAAKAMQGLLARGIHYQTEGGRSHKNGLEECDIAGHSYAMADAMLAARGVA